MAVRQCVPGHEHLGFAHPIGVIEPDIVRPASVALAFEFHRLDQCLVAETDVRAVLSGQGAALAARLALDATESPG